MAKRSRGVLTLKASPVLGRASSFRRLFPWFENYPKIEAAIFHDITDTEEITYEQYVKFLSTIAHGTPEEKVDLAVRLIDLDNNAHIEKSELVEFINVMNDVCKHRKDFVPTDAQSVANIIFSAHYHHADEEYAAVLSSKAKLIHECQYGTAENNHRDAQNLLGDKPEDLIDDDDRQSIASAMSAATETLDYPTFLEHAKECPEFSTCFGLGALIYWERIAPVIEESHCDCSMEGSLFSPVWNNRWVIVCNGFMTFYELGSDPKTAKPIEIFALREASIKPIAHKTEEDEKKFTLHVPQRNVTRVFTAESASFAQQWINTIRLNTLPTLPNRYHSFAEVHADCPVLPFANAKEFYIDLVKNIKAAQHSIFITGWHLTAQLYLTREGNGKVADRLDQLLLDRAIAGVKIYILIWDEVEAAFKLGSLEAARILNDLHSNVHVMRDPTGLKHHLHLWSHHQKTVIIDGAIGYCGGIDIALGRYDDHTYPVVDEAALTYPGLDYCNAMSQKGSQYTGDTLTERQDRKKVPRMPWHDIHMKVLGKPVLDLERNFIERWEATRSNTAWIIQPSKKVKGPAIPQENMYEKCQVQILRSIGSWSFNFKSSEHSMYTAQMDAVKRAKRTIYIENQFLISASNAELPNPNNLLLQVLVDRVVDAHEKGEDFRVLIVTPMQASSPMETLVTKTLTFWQYSSSYRGVLGFWHCLKQRGVEDVDKYVSMAALRNYGRTSDGTILTEMVYVHSKFMIVDDDLVFISSHNINDRSMLGFRDSEIGGLVKDTDTVPVTFGKNGKSAITIECGKLGHELRMKLFRTFLGLNEDKSEDHLIEDPIAAHDLFVQRAHENSLVYLDVFKRLHDNITTVRDLGYIINYEDPSKRAHVPTTDEEYERLKTGIKGFAVDFPRDFLKDSWSYPAVEGSIDAFFV